MASDVGALLLHCTPLSWYSSLFSSAGSGGPVISSGRLAHSAAPSCSASGQRQQRGVHSGVSSRTLPQGCQETLRQSWQKVKKTSDTDRKEDPCSFLFNYRSFICSLIYMQESDFLNSTFPETTDLIYIIVHGLSTFILHVMVKTVYLLSSGIQSLYSTTSWSRQWMPTGAFNELLWDASEHFTFINHSFVEQLSVKVYGHLVNFQ